ncbi:MAG: hypothetical protein ABSH39_11625 [Candidatus Acidiferrum sp.]|jgi:hypothetical protein
MPTMKTGKNLIGQAILGSTLFFSIAGLGCAARVTYYDADHHDYHRWDNHEITIYRSYWEGRHEHYREYSTLTPAEQRDYWNWRHNRS